MRNAMSLFSWIFQSPDNRQRAEGDAARKLSIAMPPAGAGAQIAGQSDDSETEKALKRATGAEQKASD